MRAIFSVDESEMMKSISHRGANINVQVIKRLRNDDRSEGESHVMSFYGDRV